MRSSTGVLVLRATKKKGVRRVKSMKSGSMTRDELRRTMTGPVTEEKRRAISDRVSDPVKSAIDKAIKQNKPALRELADH